MLSRSAPLPHRSWDYGQRADQTVDLYLPEPRRAPARDATIALVHGGFWRPEFDRTHLRPMAAELAGHGYRTALIEYPRIPGDPDASLEAVVQALATLPPSDDALPPVIVGHSAGGHLALLAARATGAARACLALAPVADLGLADRLDLDGGAVQDFLGGPADDRPDLDPALLPPPVVPVTVIHGTDDTLVPPSVSAGYCSRGTSRFVELAGTAHFQLIDPASSAWPTVIAELDALASPGGIE